MYLLGGQVLHSAGHLVSTGHQVFDGHVLHWNLVGVVAVLHPGGTPSTQVLPQVALGRKLHYDIERTCRQEGSEGCSPSQEPGEDQDVGAGPTVLCARSQKINDVLVLSNDLHHLHL